MKQVWIIDEKGFFIEDKLVSEVKEKMITVPILIGYIKPKWNGTTWIEGATEEEIKKWEQSQRIDICPTKTNQELQGEIENLKAQLETIHERLCTQQEMSATVIASVFGMEALKNE